MTEIGVFNSTLNGENRPTLTQLLIYAQRPEATAVASMEIWNQKMYRWIKKGSKGIALIDNTSGPKTKLRYVFDVGDTYKVSRCLFYFVSAKY